MSTAVTARPAAGEGPAGGFLGLAERGYLPDPVIRRGIRTLCRARLKDERAGGCERAEELFHLRLAHMGSSPIATFTERASEQHYELPAEFFAACLGPRLKYSCGYFARDGDTLAQAEIAMLTLYGSRARLADGQRILDLGCGWGALTLWAAERFPNAELTAVTNSASQRNYVLRKTRELGLRNVEVIRADIDSLQLPAGSFDRCLSIETFEHLRNYRRLLGKIHRWLTRGGELFVHLFVHRTLLYFFETAGAANWLGRHFFTGGMMPSADTLCWFQDDLTLVRRWFVSGQHYQRTANCWLQQQDQQRERILPLLQSVYGAQATSLWFNRWRIFWMARAELFGLDQGDEWLVAHYLFKQR